MDEGGGCECAAEKEEKNNYWWCCPSYRYDVFCWQIVIFGWINKYLLCVSIRNFFFNENNFFPWSAYFDFFELFLIRSWLHFFFRKKSIYCFYFFFCKLKLNIVVLFFLKNVFFNDFCYQIFCRFFRHGIFFIYLHYIIRYLYPACSQLLKWHFFS